MKAINSKLLLEPYVSDGAIKANVNKGFATVKQKSTLVPLKAIVAGTLYHRDGSVMQEIEPGDSVFFKEEDLHNHPWAKTVFTAESLDTKFIIAEASLAVMVKSATK